MTTFFWCWIALFTVTALPFGIATLCGWAPQRTRRHWSAPRIRVQGLSLLVLYVAATLHPVVRLSGAPSEDAGFFANSAVPPLIFLALGLQAGAGLHDWFGRRRAPRPRQDAPAPASFVGGSPE
ncbi:hypothetical protein [Streptomyces sp. NPDC059176]|uniref:hypothetical protein n=1 Tax=unclassified Streptomyces TaxID=2593676 RepID=UPI00368709CD